MMKVYLDEIYAGKDVRKNLISLRQELKTEEKTQGVRLSFVRGFSDISGSSEK